MPRGNLRSIRLFERGWNRNGLREWSAVLNRLRDSYRAELAFGEQPVVRSAHQAQLFRRVGATERPGALMMKLQERARFAAMPIFADERTALPIPFHDRPPHVVTHV